MPFLRLIFTVLLAAVITFPLEILAQTAYPDNCRQKGGPDVCRPPKVDEHKTYSYLDQDYVSGPPMLEVPVGGFTSLEAAEAFHVKSYFLQPCSSKWTIEKNWEALPDELGLINYEVAHFSEVVSAGDSCLLYQPHDVMMFRGNLLHCPADFELKQLKDGGQYCEGQDWIDINKNLGVPKECAGNPCNVATGNKFQQERDFIVYGPGNLEFKRYYNSMSNYNDITNTFQGTWTYTYSRRIEYKDFEHGLYSAKVYRDDGKVLHFYNVINNPSAGLNVVEKLQPIISGEKISGWKLFPGDDSVEIYDSLGRLTSITDRNGWVQSLTYDNGLKVTDTYGRTISLIYGPQSLTVIDPALNKFVYSYDAIGNLIKVTYPDGNFRQYIYNEPEFTSGINLVGALTGLIDENGSRYATWRYDVTGRVISSEHADGAERVQLEYILDPDQKNPRSTTVKNAVGGTRIHDFRVNYGDVLSIGWSGICGDCDNDDMYKDYDVYGNLREKLGQNSFTTFVFDGPNHKELSRNESGRVTQTEWHPKFRLPTLITQSKLSTKYSYDDATGLLLAKTETDLATKITRIWNYRYSGLLLSSLKGPRADVNDLTEYTYDTKGNLSTIKNAAGALTKFTSYDGNGNLLETTDPNGFVSKFIYDGRGKLTHVTKGNVTTIYAYDNVGQLKSVTLPNNVTFKYTYDNAHRLTDIETQDGERMHFTLDLMGNHEREDIFNAAGTIVQTKSATFDLAGRLHENIDAYNNRKTLNYDNNGNIQTVVDALNRSILLHTDSFDRLDEVTLNDQQSKIVAEFDDNDGVISVTSASGLKVVYDRDGFGRQRRTSTTDIDAMSIANDFDAVGNLISNSDFRGIVTSYTYDALNRLTKMSAPGATSTTLTYDTGINGIGHLTNAVDESGSTALTYSQNGLISSTVRRVGALSLVTGYKFDSAGSLMELTYPSGRILTYTYSKGKIVELTFANQQVLSGIEYQPFGAPSDWIWSNGKTYKKQYNLNGEVESYEEADSTKTLRRDAAGRINGIEDNLRADRTQNFTYDDLDHLLTYQLGLSTSPERKFTYDVEGNRKTVELDGKLFTYTYANGTNYLVSAPGPVPRQWALADALGRKFTDGTNIFTIDSYRRIASVKNSKGTTTYLRDYAGRRVSKKLPGGSTIHYVYDKDGHLIAEIDGSGATLVEYIWLNDTPVAVSQNGTIYYIYADHLNTPRTITDTANNVRWAWQSEPFGSTPADENPNGIGAFTFNLRFPGQYYDAESGLHHNYFRDYDPQTGRYVQSDPIGLDGGANTYVYVGNNPTSFIDPYGLQASINFTPDLLPTPPSKPSSMDILTYYHHEMERKSIKGPSDSVFHCVAACKAKKNGGDVSAIRWMLNMKENVDYIQNLGGRYGRKPLTHRQMVEDMNADKAVNETGLSCPDNKTCEEQCKAYVDALPSKSQKMMQKYMSSPEYRKY